MTGYGQGKVQQKGKCTCELSIDGVVANIEISIVPNNSQVIPLLVGHQYTEQTHIRKISDSAGLNIHEVNSTEISSDTKCTLWAKEVTVTPCNYVGHVIVHASESNKEIFIEGGVRNNCEWLYREIG